MSFCYFSVQMQNKLCLRSPRYQASFLYLKLSRSSSNLYNMFRIDTAYAIGSSAA